MSHTPGVHGTIRGIRGGGILHGGITDIITITVTIGTTELKIPLVGIFGGLYIRFSRDIKRLYL